jgi:hypothetical protein
VKRLAWWFALPLMFPLVIFWISSVPTVRSMLIHSGTLGGLLLPLIFVAPTFVMIFGLWHGQRRVRRAVRAARGRACVNCVHDLADLGDTGVCPECGYPFDIAADQRSWARVTMRP